MGFFSNILQSARGVNGPASTIGVDIGGSSIKVVELAERQGVLTLVTYGEAQLGPYAGKPLGSVVHLNAKQEQEALVDIIRESAAASRSAVFAMPLSSSFVSTTNITTDEEADLSSMVRVEARKLIPASLSEVTLDWAELEPGSEQTGRPVLIAAIQNSAIERFKILMQFAGFSGAPTEIECFSTNRVAAKKTSTAIIDFGAATTKMYLSHKGLLNRMHRINHGGAAVTQSYAEETDQDFAAAENQKVQMSTADPDYEALHAIHSKQYNRPLREFRQVLETYQRESGVTIEQVAICGGVSSFPGIRKLVQGAFDLEVVRLDPFSHVAYPAFMEDTMQTIGPVFVPSLGAALRDFE